MRTFSRLMHAIPLCRPVLIMLLVCTGLPLCHAIVDGNTNEMSDVWEAAYSVLDADPAADLDGDGASNRRESVASTDPLDAQSVFRMAGVQHLSSAHLIRCDSMPGKHYRVEATTNPAGSVWAAHGHVVHGTGGSVLAALPPAVPPFVAFRLQLVTDNTAVRNARPYLESVDTDVDGVPDLDEWAAGTNPFDGNSRLAITRTGIGEAVLLTWPSVTGKRYQIETTAFPGGGAWSLEGGEIEGDGSIITAAVEVSESVRYFRVQVADEDSDLDGVTDWEEKLTGLEFGPWHYRTNFPTDPASIAAIATATNRINIEPAAPVANATRQTPGGFVITRTGNLNALTVNYTVGGDARPGVHYQALTGTVVLPPGVHSADIPIMPLGDSGLDPSRSVVVTLAPATGYELGTNTAAQVNVLREAPVLVTDFGAVGDGVTDDTLAVQSAIRALEASTNHNTLHFPAGTYRLGTISPDASTPSSSRRLLKLGMTDLAGRDLVIGGDPGATLYSTVGSNRTHILVAVATFRSLAFHGLTWRKDRTVLTPTSGEPNGADGVAVVPYDLRIVAGVEFADCQFVNCHRAVSVYSLGYDAWGKLGQFQMHRCRVLNPFGSNTSNVQPAYGGGQQVYLNRWVGRAFYANNLFDGSTNGPIDLASNPGGVPKDGCHFGAPLRLVFTNNIVCRMGVEAVFQTDDAYLGTTASELLIPPPDGTTPATVMVRSGERTTYLAGQILNFRTWFFSGAEATNVILRVAGYDSATRTLSVRNEGMTPKVEGLAIPAGQPIYLQDYNPTLASIVDNRVLEGSPRGFIGIASMSKATIARNFIEGYSTSIYLYKNVANPLNPPTSGTLLDSNVILLKDTTAGLQGYGVESFGPGEIIAGNLIVTPRSYRFVGTTARTTNAWVEANTVLAIQVVRNSYDTFARSVGIGFGNGSSNNTAVANSTYGMDVGIGPENPYQPALHRVLSHHSTNDVLAIDPIGLVP